MVGKEELKGSRKGRSNRVNVQRKERIEDAAHIRNITID
jgi:hypothetical protein